MQPASTLGVRHGTRIAPIGRSPVAGNPSSPRSVLAGAVAHAVTIAAAVAFGAVLSRPVVSRLAHVVLGGAALLLLLELALPVPPLRR